MPEFSLGDQVLAVRLGGGYLRSSAEICHGYSNVCLCSDCRERDRLMDETGSSVAQPVEVAQPWEPRAA